MAGDPKISRLAELLIEKYGDEALSVATNRAVWRLAVEEFRWAALWAQVAAVVRANRPDARVTMSLWQAPVALQDLMEDPVMDVVVQDDDARRQAVHDALRDARRKRGAEAKKPRRIGHRQ